MKKIAEIMQSNWWPVAAYLVAVLWLVTINIKLLLLRAGWTGDQYLLLAQLDSTVHYMTALSLASVGAPVLGRKRTLGILVTLILLWELFEWVYQPAFSGDPLITSYSWYYADTMDDIAMGIAGTLTGVFFGTEALNGSEA